MRVLFVSLFLIIADQVSKLMVKGFSISWLGIDVEGMRYGSSINLIGDFFKLTFVENPGMAFGINVGEYSKLFLSLFSLFASIGLVVYLYKVRKQKFILRFALALIFAGAVGNLVDRMFYGVFFDYAPLFYGKVVDFMNVDFFDFTIMGHTYERWPIFNIADSAVTVGVFLLLFVQGEDKKKEKVEDELTEEVKDTSEPEISEAEANDTESGNDTTGNNEELKETVNGENNNREEVKV